MSSLVADGSGSSSFRKERRGEDPFESSLHDSFGRSANGMGDSDFHQNVAREDPFQASFVDNGGNSNGGRRSLIRRTDSGRRRIPGCGSSFRSSFSSSLTRGGGGGPLEDLAQLESSGRYGSPPPSLRESFVSPQSSKVCRPDLRIGTAGRGWQRRVGEG